MIIVKSPNNFKKSLVLLIIFFLNFLYRDLYAQYDGGIPHVTAVTPNAAALFKTTERPVGEYTGTTPTNFNLFEINSGNLTFPVQLSYNNGGIKVEELASWVGLGWNLSVGGRITRVMRGQPDDDIAHGGYLHSSLKPSGFPSTNYLTDLLSVHNGNLDLEPDLYYFSFSGISGSFYFDETGIPQLTEQKPFKIERRMVNNVLQGWVITDSKGNRFYFGQNKNQTLDGVEYTTASFMSAMGNTMPVPPPAYISTWHLLEAEDLNSKNTIRFEFSQRETEFDAISGAYANLTPVGMDCGPSDGFSDEVLVHTITSEKYLTKIDWNQGSLVFYSSDRLDFAGKKLDSIRRFDSFNKLQKKYAFGYGYFNPANSTGVDHLNKRLKLSGFSEFGGGFEESINTLFEYEENFNLPSRLSRATDYWGYYNGKNNNWTRLPNGIYSIYGLTYVKDNLGDRRADSQYGAANILKKITYPTGGTREFIYEGNQALLEFHTQIQFDDDDGQVLKDFYENAVPYLTTYSPRIIKEFSVISNDKPGNFSFQLDVSMTSVNSVTVKIFRVYDAYNEVLVAEFNDTFWGEHELDSGDYRIEVYTGDFSGLLGMYGFWTETNRTNESITYIDNEYRKANRNVGGVRVKEIRDYDSVSGQTNSTYYKYTQFNDSDVTSGVLVSPIRIMHAGTMLNVRGDCNYFRLSSSSVYPLSGYGGSYVVYPEIRTYESGNGHLDRYYSFALDPNATAVNIEEFPLVPFEDHSWRRGKLIRERVFDNSGNLIKETLNEGLGWYFLPDNNNVFNVKSQKGWKVVFYDANPPKVPASGQNYYTNFSHFSDITKKVERFFGTASTPTEVTTEYKYYSEFGYPLLKEELITFSPSKNKKTNYRYAFNTDVDFTFGLTLAESSFKSNLLTNNYLQPIEISEFETQNGGAPVILGGEKRSFSIFNTNQYHISNIKKYRSAADFTENIFSKYDNNGNLSEAYLNYGPKTVYLYSYNYNYPIAVIKNADYATVVSLLGGQSVVDSFSSTYPSDHDVQNFSQVLRVGLPQAQVISYTYNPLAGMTSMTDAKGVTTYYEYDSFGRLKSEKDQLGKVLKAYDYHYKGQ